MLHLRESFPEHPAFWMIYMEKYTPANPKNKRQTPEMPPK